MTVKEYDELKKIDAEAALERLKKAIDWKDEGDKIWSEDQHAMILAAFMLWNIKRKEKYDTTDDYSKYCASYEWHETFDDLMGFFDESKRWQEFISLKDKFTNEELMAIVLFLKNWDGDDPTQEGIISLVDKILDIRPGERVANYCAYDYEFPLYSALRHPENRYVGYDDSWSKHGMAEAKKQILGIENIDVNGDCEEAIENDKVFSSALDYDTMRNNFPLNYGNIPENRRVAPEIVLNREAAIRTMQLTGKGRGILLIKSGPLSSQDYFTTRSSWLVSNSVSGVIALPEKLYGNTWVNVYLVIFQRGSTSIRFCDAREKYIKSRDKGKQINVMTEENVAEIYKDYVSGKEFSKTVSYDEVRKNDYVLLPQRYVKTNKSQKSISIGECLKEIDRGITLSAKEMDQLIDDGKSEGVRCIVPSSLSNGVIAKTYRFDQAAFDRKINYVYKGDILVNKTGKPIRVAVADDKYIVVGNTYILRIDQKKLDPYYIKIFLETGKGQKEIEKYAVGSNTPMISIPNLKKVEIPLYKEKKRKELEEKAKDITEKVQNTVYEMSQIDEMFD